MTIEQPYLISFIYSPKVIRNNNFVEMIWRCMLRKQLQKILAVILGFMSAAILLAEATILPRGVNLSLFSILINSVGEKEMFVQVKIQVPNM